MAVARTGAAVLAGVLVGFVVPYAWLRVGAAIQGSTGARPLAFTALAVTLAGIVLSYVAVLHVAGRIVARRQPAGSARPPRQHSWNRSVGDQPRAPAQLNSLERAFVTAAVTVTLAYSVWFFGFAGSSLPAGP